jgi:hypothetical protein
VRNVGILRRFIEQIEDSHVGDSKRRSFDHLFAKINHVIKNRQRDGNAASTRLGLQSGPVSSSKKTGQTKDSSAANNSTSKPALPGPKSEASPKSSPKQGQGKGQTSKASGDTTDETTTSKKGKGKKGKGKGKKGKLGCLRMAGSGECSYGDSCHYSHAGDAQEKAKE